MSGRSFGYPAPTVAEIALDATAPKAIGEVVFNTAMSGYYEVLTDPSYTGQLVAMTYPHIGNYGCDPEWSEIGPGQAEAGRPARSGIEPAGFIVRSLYEGPVPDGRQTLEAFLNDNETPGITGIDTRALTLRLRDEGSANGVIVRPSSGDALTESELARVKAALAAFPEMEGRDLIGEVGSYETIVVNESGSPHIALLDCGSKANIVRRLTGLGCKVTLLPSTADDAMVEAAAADALFVSNGPGDPAVLERQVEVDQGVDRQAAGARDLPRTPAHRRGARREDVQDEVRSPRREPSGARRADEARVRHEPEPWLRRRRSKRCPRGARSGSATPTTAAWRVSSSTI